MTLLTNLFPPTLDEIVFEGRNQAYGAYQLRHDYQRHLASAGAYTLAIVALLLLLGATWQRLHPAVKPVFTTTRTICPMVLPTDEKTIKQAVLAQPNPAPRAPRPTRTVAATSTEIAHPDRPELLIKPAPQPLAAVVDGSAGPPTPGPATDPGLATDLDGKVGGPGEGPPTTTPASTEKFTWVEKMPEFAGGQAAMLRYLRDHLRYPRQALQAGADGKVFLSFVVQADGSIADVQVIKGLGYGLDEEAQRVVRQMPAWTPGYQAQHAVAVRFTLPINFQLQ